MNQEVDINIYEQTITEKEKNDFVNRAIDMVGIVNFDSFYDRYKWLSHRREILAELGQIHDERDLKAVASCLVPKCHGSGKS